MTVYADNAATTKMSQTALNAMLPAMEENFGNPSSLHSVGQRAAELLMKSRETVARCLNCQPREIIFTSSGSEADNRHRPPQGEDAHYFHGFRASRHSPHPEKAGEGGF